MFFCVGVLAIPIDRDQGPDAESDDKNSNYAASDSTNEIPVVADEELRGTTTAPIKVEPQASADQQNAKDESEEKMLPSTTPKTDVEVELKLIRIPMPMPFYPGSICQHRSLSGCGCMSNYGHNPYRMIALQSPFGSPMPYSSVQSLYRLGHMPTSIMVPSPNAPYFMASAMPPNVEQRALSPL